eukprot:symbB.v1.2.016007.t1/scaffold1208.1/size131501/7
MKTSFSDCSFEEQFGEEMERVACLCNAADGKTMQYLLPNKFPVIKCFVTRAASLMSSTLCSRPPSRSYIFKPNWMVLLLWRCFQELKTFKHAAGRCIEEYFVTSNAEEVGTVLHELGMSTYHHEFVKKAVTMSFSQSSEVAGREAVLHLLATLTSEGILTKDDIQWGTTRLLGQVTDLSLDYPRCTEMLTEVIIRLLTDELVSVPFLRRCRLLRIGDGAGLKVLEAVQRRTPEYSKKQLSTAAFKKEISNMILEYFNSGDQAEFGRCIRELTPVSPAQSAELVRKIMVFAMERSVKECELSMALLVWIIRHEELSPKDIENGFDDMYRHMPDVLLDVPDAEEKARTFVVEAMKNKVLRETWPDPEEPDE